MFQQNCKAILYVMQLSMLFLSYVNKTSLHNLQASSRVVEVYDINMSCIQCLASNHYAITYTQYLRETKFYRQPYDFLQHKILVQKSVLFTTCNACSAKIKLTKLFMNYIAIQILKNYCVLTCCCYSSLGYPYHDRNCSYLKFYDLTY